MNKIEMVNAKRNELSKLSDMQLIDTIIGYFNCNKTLPGEKSLKDYAIGLKNELDGTMVTGLLRDVRNELIKTFASVCVKEIPLKYVSSKYVYENPASEADTRRKVSDLPMVLTEMVPIPVNNVKNIYELPVVILPAIDLDTDTGLVDNIVCVKEDGKEPFTLGDLPKGFKKNHPELSGMTATVIATDYSNGKFDNMSYTMLIDLSQHIAA